VLFLLRVPAVIVQDILTNQGARARVWPSCAYHSLTIRTVHWYPRPIGDSPRTQSVQNLGAIHAAFSAMHAVSVGADDVEKLAT
jgi:hypothetical protein